MRNRINYRDALAEIIAFAGVSILVGCMGGQGGTDGGSGKDTGLRDDVFVGDDSTTGTIEFEVEKNPIEVGNTSGFFVRVMNSRSEPVKNINVACDSEAGVAIIEPLTGYEMTGSTGVMSGVIGCERPGSFQMACRLTVGANRRKFVGVRCTGDIPSGFQGFPGAGGGGLGGGVQNNDDGEVRIIQAGFIDDGTLSSSDTLRTASIDISQISDCDGDATTVDSEPFFDTYVTLKVQNNLAQQVRFTYLQYSVDDVDGQGTEFTSKRLGLTQETNSSLVDGGGDSSLITLPIFKAFNRAKYVGDPAGAGLQITNRSLQTVSFKLVGETASGELVEATARATASFGDFNRCK